MNKKPENIKSKLLSAFISFIGGFWISFFISIYFVDRGTAFSTIFLYSFGGAFIALVLSIFFPRTMKIIMFPFSVFSIN